METIRCEVASAHELEEKSCPSLSLSWSGQRHLASRPTAVEVFAAMVAYCIACNISHTMVGGATRAGAAPIAWAPVTVTDFRAMTGAQAAVLDAYYGVPVGGCVAAIAGALEPPTPCQQQLTSRRAAYAKSSGGHRFHSSHLSTPSHPKSLCRWTGSTYFEFVIKRRPCFCHDAIPTMN